MLIFDVSVQKIYFPRVLEVDGFINGTVRNLEPKWPLHLFVSLLQKTVVDKITYGKKINNEQS